MPQISENKYLQTLLENLVSSYETELNYSPLKIELDAKLINTKDFALLFKFISEERKRLFIFTIPGNEAISKELALVARQCVLNKNAETLLKNTSTEPKINPLKKAINNKDARIRARIQIQKSFELPKPPSIKVNQHIHQVEQVEKTEINLVPAALFEFPELQKQLKALGIEYLQNIILLKIKEFPALFRDGIIPHNLPTGFYINTNSKALCFTSTPKKLPSALAPILEKQESLILPDLELIKKLVPAHLSQNTIKLLMENQCSEDQKLALSTLFLKQPDEIKLLLNTLKQGQAKQSANKVELDFLIPLLCKQYLLGGEAHTILLTRLLKNCLNKNINLEFLKNPEVQHTLLSAKGIKNLEKLTRLPAEQKEWWNTLAKAHRLYDQEYFDFNAFFEGYTQIFLPRIAEKKLTLPNPCPITHQGHLLITLNRILDVIEHAQNPQEQCLSLANLDWGATGVHYAMTQNTQLGQLKQVASCMNIKKPEDLNTNPLHIHQELNKEDLELKPWLYRFMGQHWKAEIRLTDIEAQLFEIEKLGSWSKSQKNQLIFILTCTFADKTLLTAQQWKTSLTNCIHSLQLLAPNDRSDLLSLLSECYKFVPLPALEQVNHIIKQCMELKTTFPDKLFKEELALPLISSLEHEGFALLKVLQERIKKIEDNPEKSPFSSPIIPSFTTMLQHNRQNLSPNLINILAKLNESELTQDKVELILAALHNLEAQKGIDFKNLVLNLLSQINLSKSQSLPNIKQLHLLIEKLAVLTENIQQETLLKDLILEHNLLPGCVLGNGDISKLDDLIVDALVDAVKKRSAAFKVDTLKNELQKNLQSSLVPQQLRDQLNAELMPLFDATNDLVNLLQTPNPKFSEVIEKIRYFEEKKPPLLEGMYGVGILGKTRGEFILSYLLTGKRKANDTTTGSWFATILSTLHGQFIAKMNEFFGNPENKLKIKDLDLNTSLSWMAAFNATHSLTFFFKEELIEKKVVPALKKTLQQLNTQDPDFEQSVLNEAQIIIENEPSDLALQNYKNKIESIANYLNLLIDINHRLPNQFNTIYKQLNTGAFTRLNYIQKQILVSQLIHDKPEDLDFYLKLITQALEENPRANSEAIERAIHGVVALFNLANLDSETKTMFFKMSLAHNLNNPSPFPLAALNEMNQSSLPERSKSLIIKQVIQILLNVSTNDSAELIQNLLQQTQTFLIQNPEQTNLCLSLLKRISKEGSQYDLRDYTLILQQLQTIKQENKEKIAHILTNLAQNKRDDSARLSALLEMTKGLGRRSSADVDVVVKLFHTTPYPNTQSLNSALGAHDSVKLHAYCSNFDLNPFAKPGKKRDLAKQFATDRIQEALLSLHDLLQGIDLPHAQQMKLAKQLTFIETLGYTDPLQLNDFQKLNKLTACSRHDLQQRCCLLMQQLRANSLAPEQLERAHLELLAYLREIYFRTTGLFPHTTQMLVLLLAMNEPNSSLLMRIKTGEGKSIIAPMLSVLQWASSGTIVQFTDNLTLLLRDFENNCEPFFKFLGIKTALIQSNSAPQEFQKDGINCSTIEEMSEFYLAAKTSKKETLVESNQPIHVVLDECDTLLDQSILYKLVAESNSDKQAVTNPAQWIYPLAYQFINLPNFKNIDSALGKVWDEEEDLEEFRLFLNKEINGNFEKQNYLMAASNTQLKQWIHASCIAATLVENKHFIVQPIKEKDESGPPVTKKIICVPLIRSTPKTGSIFTETVQQALQARLKAERKEQAHYYFIDEIPSVLASQSAHGLMRMFQNTKGRLLGISATPGDKQELESLATLLGTKAISVAPYAGDNRKIHAPLFTLNRQDIIKTIHKTLDQIKLPITKPNIELMGLENINVDAAFQTHEEREALIAQTKNALLQWSHTQTQPILIINEDFDDAKAIGASLDKYKKLGFKIQVVTGNETPQELNEIIKQSGQSNTITVGTAMLAKGIDINPGDHPKGLFVIQTYADTERMTTQIAGRAARNGKPGEWLPIYQVKAPALIFEQFIYYLLPWRRQALYENAVEQLKRKLKLQSTLERIYTQTVDEVQQTVIQQIEAWENLLLELYPSDPQLPFEFYQWRELLLDELARTQENNSSEHTLEANISQFKNSVCKFWDVALEEKWLSRAQKAPYMTEEQKLTFKYLKQLDLAQELKVQRALQQQSTPFNVGTNALIQQNLDFIIRNKAGVVLDYENPVGQVKKDLELAQIKQLTPNWIVEFASFFPEAIKLLLPSNRSHNSPYVPQLFNNLIDKILEQKNKVLGNAEQKQITNSLLQHYQQGLLESNPTQIHTLFLQLKSLLLKHIKSINKFTLKDQFKMQGLILTFCTLYHNLGLPTDEKLNELQRSFNEEIMKKLAQHLMEQFAWAKETPNPIHTLFEQTAAKDAAFALHVLAKEVYQNPKDKDKVQALYTGLLEQRVLLKDKVLFSIAHTSPRKLINQVISAIDSLNNAPFCDQKFRDNCHDYVISKHHLRQFRNYLLKTSPGIRNKEDPIWNHLQQTLLGTCNRNINNSIHIIQELQATVERFCTYKIYQPYLKQLNALNQQLILSLNELNKADGLKQDAQEILLTKKVPQFAALLKVNPSQIRIQNASNGIKSYIELQVEGASLLEGFTGYKSSYLERIEQEKNEHQLIQATLEKNKTALCELADIQVLHCLPEAKRAPFEKLFSLKTLLNQDWQQNVTTFNLNEFPELIQEKLQHINKLKEWNWTLAPVDLNQLEAIVGFVPERIHVLVQEQENIASSLQETQVRIKEIEDEMLSQKNKIMAIETLIKQAQTRKQQHDCPIYEGIALIAQIMYHQKRILYFQRQLAESTATLVTFQNEATECVADLKEHKQLLDNQRLDCIAQHINQAQQDLKLYLQENSKQQVQQLEKELAALEPTFARIQKKESSKTRFQTLKFFNTSELLNYEALLAHEKAQIPKKNTASF